MAAADVLQGTPFVYRRRERTRLVTSNWLRHRPVDQNGVACAVLRCRSPLTSPLPPPPPRRAGRWVTVSRIISCSIAHGWMEWCNWLPAAHLLVTSMPLAHPRQMPMPTTPPARWVNWRINEGLVGDILIVVVIEENGAQRVELHGVVIICYSVDLISIQAASSWSERGGVGFPYSISTVSVISSLLFSHIIDWYVCTVYLILGGMGWVRRGARAVPHEERGTKELYQDQGRAAKGVVYIYVHLSHKVNTQQTHPYPALSGVHCPLSLSSTNCPSHVIIVHTYTFDSKWLLLALQSFIHSFNSFLSIKRISFHFNFQMQIVNQNVQIVFIRRRCLLFKHGRICARRQRRPKCTSAIIKLRI